MVPTHFSQSYNIIEAVAGIHIVHDITIQMFATLLPHFCISQRRHIWDNIPELWGTTSGFLSSTSGISSTDFFRGTVDLSCSGLDLSPPLGFGTLLSSPVWPRPLITSTMTIATSIKVATTAIKIPRIGVIFKNTGLTEDASAKMKVTESIAQWKTFKLSYNFQGWLVI